MSKETKKINFEKLGEAIASEFGISEVVGEIEHQTGTVWVDLPDGTTLAITAMACEDMED
jgi:hypothetical protein